MKTWSLNTFIHSIMAVAIGIVRIAMATILFPRPYGVYSVSKTRVTCNENLILCRKESDPICCVLHPAFLFSVPWWRQIFRTHDTSANLQPNSVQPKIHFLSHILQSSCFRSKQLFYTYSGAFRAVIGLHLSVFTCLKNHTEEEKHTGVSLKQSKQWHLDQQNEWMNE